MNKIKLKPKLHLLTGVNKRHERQDDGLCETLNTIIFEPKSFKRKRDENVSSLLHIRGDIQMKGHTGLIYSSKILIISEDRYKSITDELLDRDLYDETLHIRYKFEVVSTYSATEAGNYQIDIKTSHEYIETQSLFND